MKGGTLDYKCRRCGKVFSNTHVPDTTTAIICFISDAFMPSAWTGEPANLKIDGVETHCCEDGVFGIGDFIGATDDKS